MIVSLLQQAGVRIGAAAEPQQDLLHQLNQPKTVRLHGLNVMISPPARTGTWLVAVDDPGSSHLETFRVRQLQDGSHGIVLVPANAHIWSGKPTSLRELLAETARATTTWFRKQHPQAAEPHRANGRSPL